MVNLGSLWRATAFRLTATVVALFAIAAIVLVGAIYWQVNAMLTRQIAMQVSRQSAELAAYAREKSVIQLSQHVEALAKDDPALLYRVLPLGSRATTGNLKVWPIEVKVLGDVAVFRTQERDGRRRLAIGIGGKLHDGSPFLLARDASVLEQLARNVSWWFLLGTVAMAVVGVVVGLWISRVVLGRIGEITATSERIMAGQMSERILLAGSNDEIDDLARNLNRMLARIEELMRGFREVSDNIAHDLKTPLNRLRNRAEDALNSTGGERESLEQILVEADDLIRTFNALLQVARLEAGATDPEREIVELTEFARDVVEFYAPVVEDEGAAITFASSTTAMVNANKQLLAQALTNLIENALKYGAPARSCGAKQSGIKIAVEVAVLNGTVSLVVRDNGIGIQCDEREQALMRFGRLDSSRSKPGTGLGLSLVGAVARLHGGNVELSDNHPGLVATIFLPGNGKAAPGVS